MDHFNSVKFLLYVLGSSFFQSFFKIFFFDLLDFLIWNTSCTKLRLYMGLDLREGLKFCFFSICLIVLVISFPVMSQHWVNGRKGLFFPSLLSMDIEETHCMATAFVFMSSHNFQYYARLCETKTSSQNTFFFL